MTKDIFQHPDPESLPRRDEIVARTFELVRERGFAGLRMRQIAEKVGVTEGALYRHFPSKEAILLALVDRMEARLLAPVRQLAARTDLSAEEKLQQVLQHHLRTVVASQSLPILLISEVSFSEHEALRVRMRQLITAYLDTLEGTASQLGPGGKFDPREIAVLLLGLPAAVAITQRLLPDAELAGRLTGPVASKLVHLILSR